MSTEASPVVELPVPLASVLTTLMLQLARVAIAGFGIASGGPKKQFAIGWQLSPMRSEEHTSELQSLTNLVCRLLLEKKNKQEDPRAIGQRPDRRQVVKLRGAAHRLAIDVQPRCI